MYGTDGNCNAQEWADLVGFDAVRHEDQALLIEQGLYNVNGEKISKETVQTNEGQK